MALCLIEPIISVRLRLGVIAPLLAALLCMRAPMAVAQSVVETVGHGFEGWTSSDGPASLQNRGGALCVVDKGAGWLTLHASSRFHGPWGASGGTLSFRVKADTGPIRYALIAKIIGPGGSATHNIPASRLSAGAWVPISIGIEAAAWKVHGDWSKLTQNVTSFSIRIDLTDKWRDDEVNCINVVKLLRGSADNAQPEVNLVFLREVEGQLVPAGEFVEYGEPFRLELRFTDAPGEAIVATVLEWEGGGESVNLMRTGGDGLVYRSDLLRFTYEDKVQLVRE